MEIISDILYWISTGLLVPVIIALILLFLRSKGSHRNLFRKHRQRYSQPA